ncbi:hypothetical protein V1477_002684 [Vespula maculifrons]|uniref:Uncharacterized protein n=1 Tax=Vespula maculifrons TaxID=7453 RepID=A0ABD2CWG9_VESMC
MSYEDVLCQIRRKLRILNKLEKKPWSTLKMRRDAALVLLIRRISLIAPLCKEKQAASATAAAAGARSTCNGRASHFGKFGERIACYSSIET